MIASGEGTSVDTIVALASGRPPSAIAVIRASGPSAADLVRALAGRLPPPRRASLATLTDPLDGRPLDRGLVLWLPGPGSPTGEDVAEFHVHGGRAVIAAVLDALTAMPRVRLAEPGEFTRRAFLAGRMDLAAVEGVADLVAADTEAQRRQALAQAEGALGARVGAWRDRILAARALAEASLDFADEDDVAADALEQARAVAAALQADIATALAASRGAERLRDGFRVVVLGPPNAGKSSLVNALARREVAIVTAEPGTTRDLIEVHLDLDGWPVTVTDTAGLRETAGLVEQEGIRRARARAEDADLVLWLSAVDDPREPPADLPPAPMLVVATKADLLEAERRAMGPPALDREASDTASNRGGVDREASDVATLVAARTTSATVPLLPAEGGEKVPEGQMRAGAQRAPEAPDAASAPLPRRGPHPAMRATFSQRSPGEGENAATKPRLISVATGTGLSELVATIAAAASASLAGGEAALLVRARHREAAEAALAALERARAPASSPELVAEDLRLAADALGRIVGAVGVEDVLGRIFSAFCIGK
jgi:tRNA modification GTPase